VEEGPTPPKAPPLKKNLKEGKEEAEPEGKEWMEVNNSHPKKERDMTKRKLFATRTTARPLKNPASDEARISVGIASVLVGCKHKEPTSRQVSSNRFNGTVMITVSNRSNSEQYTKYLNWVTEALNKAIPRYKLDFQPFRRVPTDVNVLIDGIVLAVMAEDPIEHDSRVTRHQSW